MFPNFIEQKELLKTYHFPSRLFINKNIPVTGRSLSFYKIHLFPDFKYNSEILKYSKNKKILDMGSGINHLYKYSYICQVKSNNKIAMDLYDVNKKYNMDDVHKLFIKGSIYNTKFESKFFNIITINNLLYFWIDKPQLLLNAFKELFRILKKNGEIRIFPVFFGNYFYNNKKLYKYLNNKFCVKLVKPSKYSTEVYKYIKNNELVSGSKKAGKVEKKINNLLISHTLILKK